MPRKPQFGRVFKPHRKLKDGRRVEIRTWYIEYYANTRQIRESSKSKRYTDAEALLRRRLAEMETGSYVQPHRITVADLLDNLLYDYANNNKSIGWARYVDGHLRPFLGHIKASSIDSPRLQAYVDYRRGKGISNSTINREFTLLRRAFNLAHQETPPRVKRVLKFPKLSEPPPRAGFFEHEEYLVLRAELPDDLRPVLVFGYYSGCRRGEILSVLCNQVDLLAKVVRLEPGTTK